MTLLAVENLVIAQTRRPVTMIVPPGTMHWIMGRSGAGKTTLLRTLARLSPVIGGEMCFRGVPWTRIPAAQWRNHVAYVHQKPVMFRGSVESNIQRAFTLRTRRDRALDQNRATGLLRALGLPDNVSGRDAGTLSVGEAARVQLIRTMLTDPHVLLLDEPTAALDPDSREAVRTVLEDWLGQGGRAVVAVSHDEHFREAMPGPVLEIGSGEVEP